MGIPLVGHGDYVSVVQMSPLVIAAVLAFLWGRRIARIALQPVLNYIVVKLLGPQHPGETLAHDVLGIRREVLWNDCRVELVGLALAERERFVEVGKSVLAFEVEVGEPQPDNYGLASTDRQLVMR